MFSAKEILLVDYGMGNLFSIRKVIERLGYRCKVSHSASDIQKADRIILPGVGHFGKAMENLRKFELIEPLNEVVLVKKAPVMGICLGMQLMADSSEEGEVEGMKWFDAKVIKFHISNKELYKVPHMGWNTLKHMNHQSNILKGLGPEEEFYFVHSYHVVSENDTDILAVTNYEFSFVSAIEKENITGVQFHPEKSHRAGEMMLRNFLNK